MRKYLFGLLGLAALAAAGFAWAQGIVNLVSPVGTELMTVYPLTPAGGAGGSQAQIALNNARATTSTQLSTATSGTVTATALINRFIFSGAQITTPTVNAPASPPDGDMLEIVNGSAGAATSVTFAVTDGSTIVGSTACGALVIGGSCEWQYVKSNNSWYRLR